MCGCDVLKGHRFTLLNQTLNGFGVKLKGQELYVEAQKETFCWAKHSLLQAVLSVDDLFYSAKPNIEPFFFEDAAAWLDSLGIRYTPRLSLVGLDSKTTLISQFRSLRMPEKDLSNL